MIMRLHHLFGLAVALSPFAFGTPPALAVPLDAAYQLQAVPNRLALQTGERSAGEVPSFAGKQVSAALNAMPAEFALPAEQKIRGLSQTPSGVPEPGTLLLFGSGLVGLAAMKRRKAFFFEKKKQKAFAFAVANC